VNIIADGLTIIRGIFVLIILITGILQGTDALPQVVILTIICWLTDVLDGRFARKSNQPTHLGRFDLVTDSGLVLSLAACLVLWEIIPLEAVLAVIIIVTACDLFFHFSVPRKLAFGLMYAGLMYAAWQIRPAWFWVILVSLIFLAFLAPQRLKEQVVEFLAEAGSLFTKKKSI